MAATTLDRRRSVTPRVDAPLQPPALPGKDVWQAYRANPTTALRNQLIEAYMPLLDRIAKKLHKRLPRQVDVDDLIAEGSFGLMEAIDSYDPSMPNTFATFCSKRVFGAIIDHLRSMDPTPRLMREREAMVSQVVDDFRKQFGRAPCDEEVLGGLGKGDEEARRVLKDGVVVRMTSLSRGRPSRSGDQAPRLEETIRDRRQVSAEHEAAVADAKAFVLKRLSRAERLILVLYRAEGLRMHEIGRVLGLSESRVSQMLSVLEAKVQAHLRTRMADVA